MDVRKFMSRGGIRVYGMPVETFPGHVNNIYPFSATTLQVSRNRYRPLCFLCSFATMRAGLPSSSSQRLVYWCGHSQDYVAWPEADGYWRLVPVWEELRTQSDVQFAIAFPKPEAKQVEHRGPPEEANVEGIRW